MMHKILFWLSGWLPFREISDGNVPYLERYYLCTLFGWRFYLHQFVGSDPDRGLHDHPWPKAYSLILSGWYYEETRSGTRKVRWFNSLTGDTFHRVVLPHDFSVEQNDSYIPAPCWTLFMHKAGSVKPWGFWREKKGMYRNGVPVDGVAQFEPYTYKREGSQKDWWLIAKSRRQLAKEGA